MNDAVKNPRDVVGKTAAIAAVIETEGMTRNVGRAIAIINKFYEPHTQYKQREFCDFIRSVTDGLAKSDEIEVTNVLLRSGVISQTDNRKFVFNKESTLSTDMGTTINNVINQLPDYYFKKEGGYVKYIAHKDGLTPLFKLAFLIEKIELIMCNGELVPLHKENGRVLHVPCAERANSEEELEACYGIEDTEQWAREVAQAEREQNKIEANFFDDVDDASRTYTHEMYMPKGTTWQDIEEEYRESVSQQAHQTQQVEQVQQNTWAQEEVPKTERAQPEVQAQPEVKTETEITPFAAKIRARNKKVAGALLKVLSNENSTLHKNVMYLLEKQAHLMASTEDAANDVYMLVSNYKARNIVMPIKYVSSKDTFQQIVVPLLVHVGLANWIKVKDDYKLQWVAIADLNNVSKIDVTDAKTSSELLEKGKALRILNTVIEGTGAFVLEFGKTMLGLDAKRCEK